MGQLNFGGNLDYVGLQLGLYLGTDSGAPRI